MGTFKLKLRSLMIVLLLITTAQLFAGTPTWTRVDYTRSTTFVGVVKITQYTSTYPYSPVAGDYIGAFVNGECRMIAQIFANGTDLYVSSVIQGGDFCAPNEPNCTSTTAAEEVEFRLWSNVSNTEYGANLATRIKGTTMTIPDGNIGSASPYEIGKPNTGKDLLALTVTGATIAPAFTSATTSYTASVDAIPATTAYDIDSVSSRATSSVTTADNGNGTSTATITVTAEDGTTKTYTIVYTLNCTLTTAAAPNPSASPASICAGGSSVLSATGVTGVPFVWYTDNGLTTKLTSTTVSPAATTTYYVRQESSATCMSPSASVIVTVTTIPTITALADPKTICEGDSVTISATGADSYAWNSPLITGASNKIKLSQTSTFTVIGSFTGCTSTATASVSVTVNPKPTITTTANPTAVCSGKSATISASGAVDYVWDNLVGVGNQKPVTPQTTTTYNVTGTDANGCKNSASLVVNVNQLPVITPIASKNPVCDGETFTLSATGGVSYLWNPAASGPLTISTATKYSVTGTDTNGCENTSDITVNIGVKPTVSITATPSKVLCVNDKVTLVAAGASTLAWSDGITNNVEFTPSATKTYTVTGTNANGCSATSQVTITVSPAPGAPTVADSVACSSTNFHLTATGVPDAIITWYNGTVTSTGRTFIPTAAGTFQVDQKIGSCISPKASVTLTVKPSPAGPLCRSIDACDNDALNKRLPTATSSLANPIFYWYTGADKATRIDSGASPTHINIANYPVLFVSQMDNGCESVGAQQVTIAIKNHTEASIQQIPSSVCLSSNAINLVGIPTGGLFSGTGVSNNVFIPATAQSGSHTISYIYTDGSTKCSDTATALIEVGKAASPIATGKTVLINAAIPTLTATGTNITWLDSTKTVVATTKDYTPSASLVSTSAKNKYKIYVINTVDGCNSDTVLVTITVTDCNVDAPAVDKDVQTICEGGVFSAFTATINPTATKVIWTKVSDGSEAGTDVKFTPTVEGSYTVQQFDGCLGAAKTVRAVVNKLPSVSINQLNPVCANDVTAKTLTGLPTGGTFSGNGVTGNVFTVSSSLVSPVKVVYTYTDANQCTKSAEMSVVINSIPTAPVITDIPPVCEPGSFTLNQVGGTNVKWYDASMNLISSSVSNKADGSYVYYAIATDANQCTNSDTITVVVKPQPVAPTVTPESIPPFDVTKPITTSIKVEGTGVLSVDNNVVLTNGEVTPVLKPAGTTVTYCAKQEVDGCVSECKNIVVTFIDGSTCFTAKPIVAETTVSSCTGSVIFSANGSNIVWYNAAGDSINNGSTFTTTTSGKYYVAQRQNCLSEKVELTATVGTKPSTPVVNDTIVCQGKSGVLTTNGENIKWYGSLTSTAVIGTGNSSPVLSQVATLYATQTIGTCESDKDAGTLTIQVTTAPTAVNDTICQGEIGSISAIGTGIKWYETATSTTVYSQVSALEFNSAKKLFATQTVNTCESADRTEVNLVVNTSPAKISVVSQSIEINGTIPTFAAGVEANWYDKDNKSLASKTATYQPTVSVLDQAVYVFYVAATNGTCESEMTSFMLTVNKPNCPGAPTAKDVSVCNGETATLSATGTTGASYLWYQVSSAGIPISSGNSYSTTVAGTYYVSQTVNNCESPRMPVVLVVNPLPVVDITGVPSKMNITDAAVTISVTPLSAAITPVKGIDGYVFTPSVAGRGITTITATYTNIQTGCSASISKKIEVVDISLDTTVLSARIIEAKSIFEAAVVGTSVGQYPQDAKDAFAVAIAAAITTMRTATTQAQITQALADLNTAISTFESKKITIDKSGLQHVVDSANTILSTATVGTAVGDYPKTAKDALTAAVAVAQSVLDNASSSQADINAAKTTLENAIKTFLDSVNKEIATTGISINGGSSVTIAVNSTYQLTYTAYPTGANPKVTWTSSDESIATVDANGKVTVHSVGLATITVTVTGKSISDNIIINATTSISDMTELDVVVYPSITSTTLNIKDAKGIEKVTIVSTSSGKIVKSFDTKADFIMIDVTELSSDKYTLLLKTKKGEIITKSFVKE